jgi:hypothetical protein
MAYTFGQEGLNLMMRCFVPPEWPFTRAITPAVSMQCASFYLTVPVQPEKKVTKSPLASLIG